jgi:hypothetical protein
MSMDFTQLPSSDSARCELSRFLTQRSLEDPVSMRLHELLSEVIR